MPLDLYHCALSASCRAVLMAAKLVGVEVNLKTVDLTAKEQMKPEIGAMNPQHTVPILDDSGFYLSEGRAISAYIVNQYAKDDKLYPEDPKKRAIVDQRLYFDLGVFYASFAKCYYPVMFMSANKLEKARKEEFKEAASFLDMFLSNDKYVAGDHLTIADLALVASAANVQAVETGIFDDYPKIKEWMERCKREIPDYHTLNESGAELFGKIGQDALSQCSLDENERHRPVGCEMPVFF